eukprot:Blabericola_migrator_1__12481@NODE_78_length_15130_cov_126_174401_g70_i0_p3_GENE_NODE_78_length_15130_cov_126_174401_g70_i0NODE_78_length_15130_cov_126_174401_g70_i0_p3_ORF_typecomplete_len693_score67_81HAD_2/PF13419_6/2_2e03HAD_2/PF13419_6/5_9e05Acid_PPase/PF12689_7/0_00071PGP_phosphatase/PF09419_10/0_095_NODE_78_length_15130_cov_126_174401_g70_i069639041
MQHSNSLPGLHRKHHSAPSDYRYALMTLHRRVLTAQAAPTVSPPPPVFRHPTIPRLCLPAVTSTTVPSPAMLGTERGIVASGRGRARDRSASHIGGWDIHDPNDFGRSPLPQARRYESPYFSVTETPTASIENLKMYSPLPSINQMHHFQCRATPGNTPVHSAHSMLPSPNRDSLFKLSHSPLSRLPRESRENFEARLPNLDSRASTLSPGAKQRPLSPLRRRRGLRSSTPVRLSGELQPTSPFPPFLIATPPIPDLCCTMSSPSTPGSAQKEDEGHLPLQLDPESSTENGDSDLDSSPHVNVLGKSYDSDSSHSTVEHKWQTVSAPIMASAPKFVVPKLVLPNQPALFGIAHYRPDIPSSLPSSHSGRQMMSSHSPIPSRSPHGNGKRSRWAAEMMRTALKEWAAADRHVSRRVSVSFPLDIALQMPNLKSWTAMERVSSRRTSARVATDRGGSSPSASGRHRHQHVFGLYVENIARLTRERIIYSEDAADMLLCWLKRRNIKILAVDFDNTMTRHHSGGCLDLESRLGARLWRSLSPDMNALGVAAEQAGLPIVCVSFTDNKMKGFFTSSKNNTVAGEELVQLFMQKSGASFSLARIYPFYPRLYQSPHLFQELLQSTGCIAPADAVVMPKSKEFHLLQVCNDFGVAPEEVLLIDDDYNNITAAAASGYMALHVKKGVGLSFTSMSASLQ